MGKGSGGCDRPALSTGTLLAGPYDDLPANLQAYLAEDNEAKLLKQLPKCTSFPEYQTIIFRLSQLKQEHAVSGLLSSADYKKAKAEYEKAEKVFQEAQAKLEAVSTDKPWEPTKAELQRIRSQVFGRDWQAQLAEELFEGSAEYQELIQAGQKRAKKGKNSADKEIAELKKQMKMIMIRKGPLDPEVKKLKGQINELESGEEEQPFDPAAATAALRLKLLGDKTETDDGMAYVGGEWDLSEHIENYQIEKEAEIDIAVSEERLKHQYSGHAAEQKELEKAERELSEGHHALLVHEAAIKRAKMRAQRAREQVLKFEPQAVDKPFVDELDKFKGQIRAVFVEDSVFRDHIVNLYKEGNEYCLIAETDPNLDEKAILKTIGGKSSTYKMDLPASYGSWASGKLGAIKAVTKKTKGGEMQYTPRHSDTPHSEQGILRITGKDPQKLVEALEELKLSKGVSPVVPYDSIYRGSYRRGRVAPLYEPLASGQEALKVPDGNMVLHGLTGAAGNVPQHFEAIVKSGGLKSIAERRRMGIAGMTMSPLGDIGSGIDMGVPCKIGANTNFGSSVFLGMNPEVLSRRDMWFSDHDFGGGHDRNPEYIAYAKTLGQKGLHEPCPVKGRQKHLDTGLKKSDNEVYIEGEVSWNDVDTLFVEGSIASEIHSIVAKAKKNGLMPEHIRIAVAGQAPPAEKKAAKTSPKKRTQMTASGWTITEDGSVVLVEGTDSIEQEKKHWTIDDHIQYRSREIARTME